QELEGFVLVNQSPVGVVDDGLEAQIGDLGNQQIHLFPDLVAGRLLVQIPVQPGGGHQPLAVLVQIDVNHHIVAHLQRALLFGVRQQQVLGQAPVEEQPGTVDIHHLEAGEAADHDLGCEGGGDQSVVAVEVDEDIEPVTDLAGNVFGDLPPGQKDLPFHAAIQIEAEIRVLEHLQSVHSSDQCHALTYLADPAVPERPPVYRVVLARPITAE